MVTRLICKFCKIEFIPHNNKKSQITCGSVSCIKAYQKEYRIKNKEKFNKVHIKKKCKFCEIDFLPIRKEGQVTCGSVSCIKERKKEYYSKNKERINKRTKEYRLKNKDYRKEYIIKYRIKNKDKMKAYKLKNKDKINKIRKKYYLKNSEKIKDHLKKYYLKNSEKIKERCKKYSKKYYLNNKKDLCECGNKKQIKSKVCFKCCKFGIERMFHLNDLKKALKIAEDKNKIYKGRHGRFYLKYKGKKLSHARVTFTIYYGYIPHNMTIDHIYPVSKFPKGTSWKVINHIDNLQLLTKSENSRKHNKIILDNAISHGA